LHPDFQRAKRLLPSDRQRRQPPNFVEELRQTRLVPLGADLVQKGHIGRLVREIRTATQQQRLLHRLLESVVALLGVAVLVTLAGIDRLRRHAVMRHQGRVAASELLGAGRLHRQAHTVAAVHQRHAARRPHRVLKPHAETLKTLRKAKRHVLPVRMRQHEVIHQVRKRLAGDGHAQLGHMREVRGAETARRMVLSEEHFFGRAVLGPPLLHPPLQRPQLAVREAARMTPLQLLEQRLGFPARRRFEQFDDLVPHLGKRIGAGPPSPRRRRRPLF